jgi:hypothetical protein
MCGWRTKLKQSFTKGHIPESLMSPIERTMAILKDGKGDCDEKTVDHYRCALSARTGHGWRSLCQRPWPRPRLESRSWLEPWSCLAWFRLAPWWPGRRRHRRRSAVLESVVLPRLLSSGRHRTPGASDIHRAVATRAKYAAGGLLVLLPVTGRILSGDSGVSRELGESSASPVA